MEKTVIIRLGLALMTAAALAGCASNQYLVAEASPQQSLGAQTPLSEASEPGAKPIRVGQGGAVSGPRMYNSDNKLTITRTGLGSDPDNPNGAPL